jgi:hypothetical protein
LTKENIRREAPKIKRIPTHSCRAVSVGQICPHKGTIRHSGSPRLRTNNDTARVDGVLSLLIPVYPQQTPQDELVLKTCRVQKRWLSRAPRSCKLSGDACGKRDDRSPNHWASSQGPQVLPSRFQIVLHPLLVGALAMQADVEPICLFDFAGSHRSDLVDDDQHQISETEGIDRRADHGDNLL